MTLEETLRGFREILDGKHDDVPEQAFYMGGGIDEVLAKAKTIEDVRTALEAFEGSPLKATATNLCLVDGNPEARVMIIGPVLSRPRPRGAPGRECGRVSGGVAVAADGGVDRRRSALGHHRGGRRARRQRGRRAVASSPSSRCRGGRRAVAPGCGRVPPQAALTRR